MTLLERIKQEIQALSGAAVIPTPEVLAALRGLEISYVEEMERVEDELRQLETELVLANTEVTDANIHIATLEHKLDKAGGAPLPSRKDYTVELEEAVARLSTDQDDLAVLVRGEFNGHVDLDYGADADGNRGVEAVFVEDLDIRIFAEYTFSDDGVDITHQVRADHPDEYDRLVGILEDAARNAVGENE